MSEASSPLKSQLTAISINYVIERGVGPKGVKLVKWTRNRWSGRPKSSKVCTSENSPVDLLDPPNVVKAIPCMSRLGGGNQSGYARVVLTSSLG
ncbi:unnamed protein product [Protopolystoma xenopodis]|uniref:Uncharacterized protein n=1 Tax=Protopolystoma xenopodis TaxID=117903 RepID=A0A448XQN6_9PLAT|nr:unnamed protein product [Protopolystoma xenopodis]